MLKTWLVLTLLAGNTAAQTQAPLLPDPWLPAAARSAALAPATSGKALQAQVLAKLTAQFAQADTGQRGAVSLAEAERAGWGFAVANFAALDASKRGEIRLQDVQRFVQETQKQQQQGTIAP